MLAPFKRLLKQTAIFTYDLLPGSALNKVISTYPKVLMYHRVIPKDLPKDESSYPLEPGMFVRPETFEKHLIFFKENYDVVFLSEIIKELNQNPKSNKKLLALTFDDAWYDNFKYAAPLLIKHNLPATIFVPTKFVDERKQLFWTDKIALALKNCPEKLIELFQKEGLLTEKQDFQQTEDDLYFALNLLKSAPAIKRDKVLSLITPLLNKTSEQFMSWDDIKSLPKNLFHFGAHSHNHNFSDELTEKEFEEDVKTSIKSLKKHLPKEQLSTSFCYPSGRYNKMNQKVLSSLDFFSSSLAVTKEHYFSKSPKIIGRTGIHEDISQTTPQLKFRLDLQA